MLGIPRWSVTAQVGITCKFSICRERRDGEAHDAAVSDKESRHGPNDGSNHVPPRRMLSRSKECLRTGHAMPGNVLGHTAGAPGRLSCSSRGNLEIMSQNARSGSLRRLNRKANSPR